MTSNPRERTHEEQYKLIALDLDDTLLDADKQIAQRDLEAVRQCISAGVEVVIATGRSKWTTWPVAEQIGPDIPLICNTGGITFDGTGQPIRHLTLPLELARDMLHHMRKADIPARVDVGDNVFFTEQPDFVIPKLQGTLAADLADNLAGAPDQMVVWGAEATEWVVKHYSYLEGELQLLVLPSIDEPRVVHILHPRATKGSALADYSRRQGIERRETIAFGDSLNDFSLLSYAGMGVAMAFHEPRLRLVADKVLRDGETIADVLQQYVLSTSVRH